MFYIDNSRLYCILKVLILGCSDETEPSQISRMGSNNRIDLNPSVGIVMEGHITHLHVPTGEQQPQKELLQSTSGSAFDDILLISYRLANDE
jgi:hypothetical protein